jgi:hypothetical protein
LPAQVKPPTAYSGFHSARSNLDIYLADQSRDKT